MKVGSQLAIFAAVADEDCAHGASCRSDRKWSALGIRSDPIGHERSRKLSSASALIVAKSCHESPSRTCAPHLTTTKSRQPQLSDNVQSLGWERTRIHSSPIIEQQIGAFGRQ